MTDSLVPAVLILGVSMLVAASMLGISWFFGRPKRSRVDTSPYECGILPFDQVERHRFSVKFYLVAVLFILFDIEAAFLIPWAVTFQTFADARAFVLIEMSVFLAILIAGFVYVWSRGALEWD